jgi:hypothetical protein
VLLREEGVSDVSRLAGLQDGAGRDVGDVEAAHEEHLLGLRLVVPVAAPPGPGVPQGGPPRDDVDAAPLPRRRVLDPEFLVLTAPERLDSEGLLWA